MYNKVILIGRVGRDADIRYMQNAERGVMKFTLATSRKWKDKDGNWQESTQWHNIVFWGSRNLDNLASRLAKGTLAMVDGEIQYRQWEDKNGETHYITEIRAYKIMPLEKRGERTASQSETGNEQSDGEIPPADDYKKSENSDETEDDLPF
ncbi:single-stranded DNA-binding protein [bacterium]|nr:single-stranded DNA-binding protein [bacterium]